MTNTIGEFAKAKLMFCIGTNMTEAHPVAATFLKNGVASGSKLIVVDPRRQELADYADIFAQLRVGSDIAFINGVMNVLINEDLYDKKFVEENCENFEEFKAKVMEYPVSRAAEISGVPEQTIIDIARMLGSIKPAMVIYTLGITEHVSGKRNVMTLANLQMLLGNMGVECGGVNPMRGQNNVQGACDMGALPNMYPGYQSVANPDLNKKFAKFWGNESLPDKPGLMIGRMVNGLPEGKLKAFWIFGENLVATEPDPRHVAHCLNSAEFLIAQDIFNTETTQYADVILPSAAWCEDEGTFTNTERRVSRVRKIKEAPGEAKPNWWVFKEIAKRFGHDWPSTGGQELWDNEIAVLCPAFAGIKFDRMDKIGGIQWPCPTAEHPGTPVLHKDGKFTRGKGLFQAIDWVPSSELPDEEYPMVLSTGRRLVHYHSRTQTGRSKGMNERMPEEFADISVQDAEKLGIAHGETIRILSRRGEVKIKANVSKRIAPGMIWMSFHFWDTNANHLLSGDLKHFDPDTLTPSFKACAARIEKIA